MENLTNNTMTNGKDFCLFENIEGKVISSGPIDSNLVIPEDASAFTYIRQQEEEFTIKRGRIGQRIPKSAFDLYIKDEIKNSTNPIVVTYIAHSDFCKIVSSNGFKGERTYFYAVTDDDIVVEDKEQLQQALQEAVLQTKAPSLIKK